MRYQNPAYKNMTERELLRMEAREHDALLEDARPFWGTSLRFTEERVRCVYDHCFRRGAHRNGFRKRRMFFDLMDPKDLSERIVLDVGCGNGANAVFLAMKGAIVYGIDISRTGVQTAQRIARHNDVEDRCHFSRQTISRLAYRDEMFDYVIYSSVLHHVLKYPDVREETLRVLKPGGTCLFNEGIRGNPVYRAVRDWSRRWADREQVLGDVDLDYDDLLKFGRGFSLTHLETYTFFQGIKYVVGDHADNAWWKRMLFFVAWLLDRLILRVFPLKRYCLEAVGAYRK